MTLMKIVNFGAAIEPSENSEKNIEPSDNRKRGRVKK